MDCAERSARLQDILGIDLVYELCIGDQSCKPEQISEISWLPYPRIEGS